MGSIAQILHILLGRDALYLLERALQDGAVGEAAVLGHGIVPPVGMGSDALAGGFFTTEPSGKPMNSGYIQANADKR